MSRNGTGTYNLPPSNPVVSGTSVASAWANTTMTDIASALTGSVASDGQTPMTGRLDMNSNKIINLADGTALTDAVNLGQLVDPTFSGNVNIGGTLTVGGNVTLNSTGDIKLPAGTTAQRPAEPLNGMVRFNTTLGQYEAFNTRNSSASLLAISNTLFVASATTDGPHGLVTGDYVTIAGCTPAAYNGSFTITVTGNTTFDYTMLTNPLGAATVVGTYVIGSWAGIGGGASGGGNNQVFVLNDQVVTVSYNIPTGKNASSAGPITIATGVTVTVPTDSTWVIV